MTDYLPYDENQNWTITLQIIIIFDILEQSMSRRDF